MRVRSLIGWASVAAAAAACVVAGLDCAGTEPTPAGRAPAGQAPSDPPAAPARKRGAVGGGRAAQPPVPERPAPRAKPAAAVTSGPTVAVSVVAGGVPLVGASVRELLTGDEVGARDAPQPVPTDAEGVARIAARGEGGTWIEVVAPGFARHRELVAAGASEHRVELVAGVTLRGRVLLAPSREPCAGVVVRAFARNELGGQEADPSRDDRPADGSFGGERTTGADGAFEIHGARDDESVFVLAAHPGYRSVMWSGDAGASTAPIVLVLGEGGVLTGRVTDADGVALAGAVVIQLPASRGPPPLVDLEHAGSPPWADLYRFVHPAVLTDARGAYRFEGMPLNSEKGEIARRAVARDPRGVLAASDAATFRQPGEVVVRDIVMPRTATVRLLPPAAGEGVRLASVSLLRVDLRDDREPLRRAVVPGEAPEFADVPFGRYEVSAGLDADEAASFEWRWRIDVATPRADVPVPLDGLRTVAGVVEFAGGGPIAGADVFAQSRSPDDRPWFCARARSASDGSFTIRCAPRRELWLSAIPPPEAGAMTENVAAAADAEGVRIVVHRMATVVGRFDPAPGGRVECRVRQDQTTSTFTIEPGADGRFSVALPPGEGLVRLVFDPPSHPVAVRELLRTPGTTDLGVVSFETCRLILLLRDEDGRPIAGAAARVLDLGIDATGKSDGKGVLDLGMVPLGPIRRVLVERTGTTPGTRVPVPDPAASPVTATIRRGAVVTGRLTAPEGTNFGALSISFRLTEDDDPDQTTTWVLPAADGTFVARLEAGAWRAFVRTRDEAQRARSERVAFVVADGDRLAFEIAVR